MLKGIFQEISNQNYSSYASSLTQTNFYKSIAFHLYFLLVAPGLVQAESRKAACFSRALVLDIFQLINSICEPV